MKAIYTVRVHDGAVVVEDQDQGRSVTNDAENVVAELRERGFDSSMPVIYRDTMGLWSGLTVSGGAFAGFYPLGKEGCGDYDAARAILRELVEGRAAWLGDARPKGSAATGPFTEPLSDVLDLDAWTETRGTATRQPDGSHRVEQEDGTAFTLPPSGRRSPCRGPRSEDARGRSGSGERRRLEATDDADPPSDAPGDRSATASRTSA